MPVNVKCSLSLWFLSQTEDTNLTQLLLQGFLQERETEKKNSSRQRTTAENRLWPFESHAYQEYKAEIIRDPFSWAQTLFFKASCQHPEELNKSDPGSARSIGW